MLVNSKKQNSKKQNWEKENAFLGIIDITVNLSTNKKSKKYNIYCEDINQYISILKKIIIELKERYVYNEELKKKKSNQKDEKNTDNEPDVPRKWPIINVFNNPILDLESIKNIDNDFDIDDLEDDSINKAGEDSNILDIFIDTIKKTSLSNTTKKRIAKDIEEKLKKQKQGQKKITKTKRKSKWDLDLSFLDNK